MAAHKGDLLVRRRPPAHRRSRAALAGLPGRRMRHPLADSYFGTLRLMTTSSEHYAHHLGPVYSWMAGDLEAASERATAELDALGLPRETHGVAVDLGAGFGLHALPLARRGYSVTAIDSCQTLVGELQRRTAGMRVNAVAADILDFPKYVSKPVEVILCMGDTLTHLPERDSVQHLFSDVAVSLTLGGLFVATFRDYVSAPLQGDRRFIPVRSDENRILTCFLEYGEDTVTVHDLLHQRTNGQWQQRVSSYRKLRLHPEWVAAQLAARGLKVRTGAGPSGMTMVAATKG
jgi:SAM-dependent methyltransferase